MAVSNEINKLNSMLILELEDRTNKISNEITDYISAKSKKLRPLLLFLFAKSLGVEIDDRVYNLACAVELMHNATLVHDDILDNADTRRGKVSLNIKLGNNLSVLSGDILLIRALKKLSLCGEIKIIDIFADCLYKMCKGEVNQNFSIGSVPSMEEYIEKSVFKTAELYSAALVSLCYLNDIKFKENIINFANNFGIAFQIRDDLLNILNTDKTKPIFSDIHNGIYTAPVIYLNQDIKIENLSEKDIINLVKNSKYITKTEELIKYYAKEAEKSIEFIPQSIYKQEIIKITENLYKAGINE